ncbi:hypothetical protein BV898_11390 [Hypsibius exemplaris]|uniref:Uncharacterized protein n=1 Tax=Hypsibius exemplaris TaxID=2072580 RepID=A0A1W0WH07_HYPEX|nr:hypothetical protein BV898_11390 [Hypsibius exemplaris]
MPEDLDLRTAKERPTHLRAPERIRNVVRGLFRHYEVSVRTVITHGRRNLRHDLPFNAANLGSLSMEPLEKPNF